jgi:hypothetical protein
MLVLAALAGVPSASGAGGGLGACLLPGKQCERVAKFRERWGGPGFESLDVVPVKSAAAAEPATKGEGGFEVDGANALVAARERMIGPCRFNADESRIEVSAEALAYSDEGFARCLSAAFAQARYPEVEALWLHEMDEHEAWIVRGGVLEKVAADAKLEAPTARDLWASFAGRELVDSLRRGAEAERAIASETEGTELEGSVRRLLGTR